jgi:thiamine-monophosphate kinase
MQCGGRKTRHRKERSLVAGSPEDDLIARHFAPIAGKGGLGLGDDAALLATHPGEELVITKDMLVAGVHFFADDPPASIAIKALGVNLSDLAAKAATPRAFLLGLGLPRELTGEQRETWLREFTQSLGAFAKASGCGLIGGDTVSSPERLMISITAFGSVPTGQMVRRNGVRPGDELLVSGTIGDAALGLRLRLEADATWARALSADHREFLLGRYLRPEPRNVLTPLLRAYAHAGMDVSDGLVGDLAKMLRVSGCGGRIDAGSVPLSSAARAAIALEPALMEVALTGGDDYEVLVSAEPAQSDALVAGATRLGLALTRIGEAHEGAGDLIVTRDGEPMRFAKTAYSHV